MSALVLLLCAGYAAPAMAPLQPAGQYVLRLVYIDDIYVYKDHVRCAIGAAFVDVNPDVIPDGMKRFVECVKIGGM